MSGDDDSEGMKPLKGSPRAVLLALYALKFARRSERISDSEKSELKNTLQNNLSINSEIFRKVEI